MEEHVSDMTGIAGVMAVAVVFGLLFVRLRQPPVVGYILAGLILGPTGLGLVRGNAEISLLAELGVVMLLFLIGMELSVRAFLLVLRPATITALAQIAIALVITFMFGALLGWPVKQSVLLAFIVAISSTAVAVRMLDEIGELRTETGRITVGVLIAQDIALVPMLIVVGAFSGESVPLEEIGWKLIVAVVVLAGLFRLLTRRNKIVLPFTAAIHGRVDLVALAMIAFCFGAAVVTSLLGLSAAFGAFLAGLVVANSTLRSEAIHVTEPIQSVLLVVFFLSIGLLIDLEFVIDNLGTVLVFLVGVLLVKSVCNVAILHLAGEPWERAFPAGLMMAQIGEFSFVLAVVGFGNGMIDLAGYKLAIAVIAMSLLVSPFWMASLRRFGDVARTGVTDFRTALADVYAGELHEIERGADIVRRASRAAATQAQAVRLAWTRNRQRRRTAKTDPARADPARADNDDPTTQAATADAWPPDDADAPKPRGGD